MLFSQLLAKPDDPFLNKEFAKRSEAEGDLRLAFAALERIVTSSPGDAEAQAEFDRVRKKLMPAVTRFTVEGGASYVSNAPQAPGGARRQDDVTFTAAIGVADERTIAGIRWRTRATAYGQLQAEISDLNYISTAAESGPVFYLTPEIWLHVMGGVAYAWLDGNKLYDDASVGLTLGGLYKGLTQTVTARYTWRDGNFTDQGANEGRIIDLEGRFVFSPSLLTGDLLYVVPRFQNSSAHGGPRSAFVTNNVDFSFSYVRQLFPGDFNDVGGRIAYFFPIDRGRAYIGAGIGVYERWYNEKIDNVSDPTANGDRRDFYIEPTAHLILPNFIAPSVDLRFDYRFEGNYSNDSTRDYESHVVGVRVVGRF